jgi:hypothetical protein
MGIFAVMGLGDVVSLGADHQEDQRFFASAEAYLAACLDFESGDLAGAAEIDHVVASQAAQHLREAPGEARVPGRL